MILTDYYRFEKISTKAKTRLDCTLSTASYTELEEKRAAKSTKENARADAINAGDLIIYFCDVPETFSSNARRKADKSITIKGKNLSSVYVPNPEEPFAFGDCKGTSDAMLFAFHDLKITDGRIEAGGAIDVYIARGQSRNRNAIYNAFLDGGLQDDIEELQARARGLKNGL